MSNSRMLVGSFEFQDVMSDLGLRFAEAPLHRIGFELAEPEIQILADAYTDRIFRARRKAAPERMQWHYLLLRFGDHAFAFAMGEPRNRLEIYASTQAQAESLLTELRGKLKEHQAEDAAFFYMLRYDYSEFMAERVEHVPEDPGDEFMRLCYGTDIELWLQQFTERTLGRAGGLTILEGPPGTGKTSLVTTMIRRLGQSHAFYILPAAQDSALSSPELVPFWQKQNKRHPDRVKVVVIEDAERLLWPRTGENREAVSSVLNIADGLIGRMLRLHILCSVNARVEDLDPAIMRPGRLMNQRAFRRLPRDRARQLAEMKALPFTPGDDREDFALAEVLNPETGQPAPSRRAIGFSR